MRMYGEWNEGSHTVATASDATTVDELRAERGAYRIFTVDEAVDHVRTNFVLGLHPLCGGVPPSLAWPYLRRVVDDVTPRVS
jgi:hypothetical protein